MPFVPPLFKDLGKKTKDVLSKKFDFKHELKTVNKAAGGLTLEAGSSHVKGLNTYVKGVYKDSSFGEAETEIHTAAAAKDTKAKVTLNKFYDGAAVSVSGTSEPAVTVDATYKQDMIASQLIINQNAKALGLNLNASVGMNNTTVGVTSALDLTGGNFSLKNLDFGAQTQFAGVHSALTTAKNQKDLKLSLFHAPCKQLSLAGALQFTPADQSYSINLGTEYVLDKATSVKGRATDAGAVALAVEHKLDIAKLTVSAEFDALNLGQPAKKFGMGVVFGDY